jgi:two-component system phosphate regulon response regulator PhoB
VFRGGDAIVLRPVEFRLLRILIEHPGRVFSREQLLDAVWDRDAEIEPRTVDVHVRRLRKALNAGGRRELIRTVRAAGYAFEPAGVDEVA